MNYNWLKINSDEFKYQLYHHNYEIFSWIEKENDKLVSLIQQYSKDGLKLINTFRSIKEAALKTFITENNICKICDKFTKISKNFFDVEESDWDLLRMEDLIVMKVNSQIKKNRKKKKKIKLQK